MTASPLQTNQAADIARLSDATLSDASELAALYERDYLAWIEATLQRLSQQDYEHLDWDNLVEEIADMGRSEKRRIESNLMIVLVHLLKWQYQPERRSRSWNASIVEHRIRVKKNLKYSPSLKPFIEEEFLDIYDDAIKIAVAETQLRLETFPIDCPYTIDQVLDDSFLPE